MLKARKIPTAAQVREIRHEIRRASKALFSVALFAVVVAVLAASCRGDTSSGAQPSASAIRPTAPAGLRVPTLAGTPPVPNSDACRNIFHGGGNATVIRLTAEHGQPTGCGSLYYRANGTECIRTLLYGPNACPDTPTPRMVVVLDMPGTATNPQPGFLTCVRPDAAAASVCGVDHPHSYSVAISAAWVFSPYPTGAAQVAVQRDKLPTPPPVGGYAPIIPPPGAAGDPVECVGNGTQQWTFHIASHTYVPGRCPAPWN